MDPQPQLPTPPPTPPAPETPGGVDLSDNALKQVRNGLISALSHDADVTAAIKHLLTDVLIEVGVLTVGNFGAAFRADPNVYQRIADTSYGADIEAQKHEPPGG